MTDYELEALMQRVNAGDSEAQAEIDIWIEQALGSVYVAPPLDDDERTAEIVGYDRLECCGTCSGGFAG